MRRDAQATLDRLGIAVDAGRPLGGLRPAERTLVAIARALRGREELHSGVLVLDEPTARLPEADVEPLLAALRRYAANGQAIVYVSHRLEEVLAVSDRVTVLRDGKVVATDDTASLDEAKLARVIVGHAVASVTQPAAVRQASGPPVLELRGVSAGPLREISLSLCPGEVLGVAGLVGAGRTTLLEAIYGARPVHTGTILLDNEPLPGSIRTSIRRGLSYVPEDRAGDGAFLALGIPENLSAARPGRHRHGVWFGHGRERASAADAIRSFAIKAPSATAPLTMLSGGNQQKVVVAREVARNPNVLIAAQPTRGLDVGAIEYVHRRLVAERDAGRAVLLVSLELEEVLSLADRIIVMFEGEIVGEYPPTVSEEELGIAMTGGRRKEQSAA
jgi:ribose transport system ATP-binding protein